MTTSPSRVGASSTSPANPGPVPPESGERPLSAGSSSIGKASTSVGPSLPRNRWLRSAMASSSTNSRDNSASPAMPSSASTASASRTQRRVSTATSPCSSAANTSTVMTASTLRSPGGLVGGDDVLHDAMADHVPAAQVDPGQTVDAGEDRLQPVQPRPPSGQVDLRVVAGHDHLGAEPDPSEEHLHLLRRGVLGLVEDDEAVVERTPPHIGERGHLHRARLEQPAGALGAEHVVQGVVERPQVRVDLGHEVAGQEAEALAGLDRRAG